MMNALHGNPFRLFAGAVIIAGLASPSIIQAQSVVDRLSGFDESRLASVAPWAEQPEDERLGREAAKLLYQVNRLARSGTLAGDSSTTDPSADSSSAAIGHRGSIRGQATAIDSWKLPESLAEVLEFDAVYRVEVTASGSSNPTVVITSEVPEAWLAANGSKSIHETSATGVWLRAAGDGLAVIAAPSLTWLANAKSDVPADWALLGEHGFDVSLLEGVRARDRQPLRSEDSNAFYGLLNVAAAIGSARDVTLSDGTEVIPSREPAADLLRNSAAMVGRFVRIDVQTIRVLRVAVTEPSTKEQLGSGHYWQIDAIGDLGNVIIRIESEGDQAATFENRYPVSIAVRELPAFLESLIDQSTGTPAESSDMAMLATKISVDGFFYRLWSYQSDYMARHGGGSQFGPLVIASGISDIEPPRGDVVGVSRIGWYLAALTLFAILATIAGSIITSRRDAAAKRRQQGELPDQIFD